MPVSFSIADSSDGPRKVVIWVTGELDSDTARAVRARLAQAQRHARSDVILDMTGVTFADSAGLTAIVNGAREFGISRQLRVISPADRVVKAFENSGLTDVFQLLPDRRARSDRRRQDLPVEFDRRRGGDRRFTNGSYDGEPVTGQKPAPSQS